MEPTEEVGGFLHMAADIPGRYDNALMEYRALPEPQPLEPVLLRVPMLGGITPWPFWQHMYREPPCQRSPTRRRNPFAWSS